LQKSPKPTKLRYLNPLDKLETSTVERFSASLIAFLATILESNAALAPTRLLIEGCFRFDPSRPDAAADFLKGLPGFDVVVWTDGSVSSPLGAGDAVI